jgi:hypothetical protein
VLRQKHQQLPKQDVATLLMGDAKLPKMMPAEQGDTDNKSNHYEMYMG